MHRSDSASPTQTTSPTWDEFGRRLHEPLELDRLAYVLVNETCRVTNADRVTLMLKRRGWEVAAVSGQDVFDRRSNVLRELETFLATVAAANEPFFYDGTPARDAAPEIEAALQWLIDQTQARQVAAVPVTALAPNDEKSERPAEPRVIAWLVAERFTVRDDGALLSTQLQQASTYAATALQHALRWHDLPLRRLGEFLERWFPRGRPSRGVWIAAALVVFAVALLSQPADLKIEADGTLQPQQRRHVFAPAEGIIVELNVREGEHVAAGAKLLSLRRPELDFELTRVTGEIQTYEKRLAGVRAARLRSSTPPGAEELARLTAEEVETVQQLDGLHKQRAELEGQQKSLIVTAPIAGQVLTWDVTRQLTARPVQKGMLLLTIGDVAGPWELELQVPDEYVGYVRAARDVAPNQTPTVEFVSASATDTTYLAHLGKLAVRSEVGPEGRSTVVATAEVDRNVPPNVLHPSAAISAKIDCGRAPLGYVWFLDVIHLLRTRLFF